MTTEDRELELWKQEWRAEAAGSLAQLRGRVRLHTARMIASNLIGVGAGVGVLIFVAHIVLRESSLRSTVWGVGVLLCWLATFIFIVWNQIGIWRVEAERTRAYAELLYKRALTKVRKNRFMLILVSFGMAFDFVYLAWPDWPPTGPRAVAFFSDVARISVAFLVLWQFIHWYGRRKAEQAEQARRFMEELEG